MSYLVRPSPTMSFRLLRSSLTLFHIPSTVTVEHSALSEDEDKDIAMYRFKKASQGVPCVHIPTGSEGMLLDDEGDDMWSYEDPRGNKIVVSAYELSLGSRTADFFLKTAVLNTPEGQAALQSAWPEPLSFVSVRHRIDGGADVDPTLCIRDIYERGYKNLGTDKELTEKGLVEASEAYLSYDTEDKVIPIYVTIKDAKEFGKGWYLFRIRVRLLGGALIIVLGTQIIAPFLYEMYIALITPLPYVTHAQSARASRA